MQRIHDQIHGLSSSQPESVYILSSSRETISGLPDDKALHFCHFILISYPFIRGLMEREDWSALGLEDTSVPMNANELLDPTYPAHDHT